MTLNQRFSLLFCGFFLLLTVSSCEKEPGFGGLASISGKVYAYDYNNSGRLEAEGYTGDIVVYLAAENSDEILERARTDFKGAYVFRELRKGTYHVWVYSECDKCTNNQEAVIKKVVVKSNKENIRLEDFKINI
jgi:hypothetical protein